MFEIVKICVFQFMFIYSSCVCDVSEKSENPYILVAAVWQLKGIYSLLNSISQTDV